jgi:hypothetical protein
MLLMKCMYCRASETPTSELTQLSLHPPWTYPGPAFVHCQAPSRCATHVAASAGREECGENVMVVGKSSVDGNAQRVCVARTSGALENDWVVVALKLSLPDSLKVLVFQPKSDTQKGVKFREFHALNPCYFGKQRMTFQRMLSIMIHPDGHCQDFVRHVSALINTERGVE